MNKEQLYTVKKIAERSEVELSFKYDRIGLIMDLDFVNDRIPLDFEKLFNFDSFNFAHDLIGIYQNFDRRTKTMLNCFVPRCAK